MATTKTAKTIDTSRVVVTNRLSAVAAAQAQTSATTLVQNQGTAGSKPKSGNPPQGFAGPSPSIPTPSKPSADSLAPSTPADKAATINQALGLVDRNTAVQTLFGVGSGSNAVASERDRLTDLQGSTNRFNQPAFDQGFGSKPASLASNPVASRPTSGGSAAVFNPMDQFKGGAVGGPLGAAAAGDAKTLGDFNNKGLIADGDLDPSVMTTAGSVATAVGTAAANSTPTVALVTALQGGGVVSTLGNSVLTGIVAGGASTMATAGAGLFAAFTVGAAIGSAMDKGLTAVFGKSIGDKIYDGIHPNEDSPATKPNAGGGAGMPDPENTGSKVNITTQTLLDQLIAAKAGKPATQGGSGDITPVTNGGIDALARNGSITANQASGQGQSLFGQPVNPAIGDNMSGGNKGLNGFRGSNGAGVINPGNEAGSPVGDVRYQQDPANALGGNKPAPAGPSLPATPSSPSEQSSNVSTTLAAGVRNLTLTGTAAINGTGNALDNLINGNAAANELRGEAGNDLLDGGAGRDQLTGGSGADRFRFSTPGAFGTAQADRITDFSRSEGDRIELSRSAFGLAAGATITFQAVSNDADLNRALGSSTLLVQDLRNGSILFNQNGAAAGAGQGGVFAMVNAGLSLQAGDFALIA